MRPPLSRCRGGRPAGLTLIELMVTVAIVAIVSSVAYPSYMNQVQKGRRGDGQAVLLEASQYMERFATQNMRFNSDRAGVAVALPAILSQAPKNGATKYYNVSILNVGQTSFTLQAVPIGTNASDACGTMTLNDQGVKTAALASCWKN